MFCRFFALFSCLVFFTEAKHLPSYIKACKADDPNFNACGVKNANEALAHILKGDPDFKIPNFTPFHIPAIEVEPSGGLLFRLKDVQLRGLETMHVTDMNIDLKNRHINLKATIKQTELNGTYESEGKLFTIQIHASGPAHIFADNITIDYDLDYKLTTKNGKEFIDVNSIKSNVKLQENVHYQFDNIFGDNKLLTDNFNQLLNENPKEVDELAGATNRQIVSQIVFEVFKVVFRVVPYHEIFL